MNINLIPVVTERDSVVSRRNNCLEFVKGLIYFRFLINDLIMINTDLCLVAGGFLAVVHTFDRLQYINLNLQ